MPMTSIPKTTEDGKQLWLTREDAQALMRSELRALVDTVTASIRDEVGQMIAARRYPLTGAIREEEVGCLIENVVSFIDDVRDTTLRVIETVYAQFGSAGSGPDV
jgi:hypothetical protein